MILIDSNVPMYLVGAPHPHKADAQRLLERCVPGVSTVLTFDSGFDAVPGVRRLS